MSDTVTPTLEPVATEAALKDIVKDIAFARQIVAAIKSGGVQAAASLIPDAVAAVDRTVKDVEAALPEIKAGYKTSEFWVTIGSMALVLGYETIAGKELSTNATVLVGAVVTIYTAARTLFKAKAPAPAASAVK
jgi:hypothetical protein